MGINPEERQMRFDVSIQVMFVLRQTEVDEIDGDNCSDGDGDGCLRNDKR